MLQRKLLVILASIFVASSASIECEDDEGSWTEEKPFQIVMSWYLKHAYTITVRIIDRKEFGSVYRHSSRFISVIYEKGDTAVLVKEHLIRDDEKSCELREMDCRVNEVDSSRKTESSFDQGWPDMNQTSFAGRSGGAMAILLIPDEATFQTFLDNGASWRKKKVKLVLIVVIPESSNLLCKENAEKHIWKQSFRNILKRIWTEDKVLNIFLSAPTSKCIKDYLFAWNPFATSKNGERGALKRLKVTAGNPNAYKSLSKFVNNLKNMNGYPLKVTMFERSPTLLVKSKLDDVSDVKTKVELDIDDITGLDGQVLRTMYSRMNCSVQLYPPSDGLEYGYQMDNGTFVGLTGDIVYRRVDFAANGLFLKDYRTQTATEFTASIGFDSMCIVVPRASMIPYWLQMFQCFSPLVWNLLFFYVVVFGLLRHLLRTLLRERHPSRNMLSILMETALIFVSSPQSLPKLYSERILVGFFLLINIIIIGTFQSTLYEGFTNPRYYKDLNTLAELDESGIAIGTGSPNLLNIFGEDDDSPTLKHLREKIQVSTASVSSTLNRTAWERDIAAIERKNDLQLTISTKYLDQHGDRMLHVVDECPRTYHLTYMAPSGAFFLPRMNVLLRRMCESGLISYWYNSTIHFLIMKHYYGMQKKIELEDNTAPFNLKNLQISFMTLIGGLFLSILIFIGEIVYNRYRIMRRKKKGESYECDEELCSAK